METTVKQEVTRKMTPQERRLENSRLLSLLARKETLEAEKKASASKFKGQIDQVVAELNETRGRLTSGEVSVLVECTVVRDDRMGVIRYLSKESGELINERAMSVEERQAPLPHMDGEDDGFDGDFEEAEEGSFAAQAFEAGQGEDDGGEPEGAPGDEEELAATEALLKAQAEADGEDDLD